MEYTLEKDMPYTMEYLNKFFGNLLQGEKNLLENREMQIKESGSTQKTAEKILEILKDNPKATRIELTQILGVSVDSVKWHLKTLKGEEKSVVSVRTKAAIGKWWNRKER